MLTDPQSGEGPNVEEFGFGAAALGGPVVTDGIGVMIDWHSANSVGGTHPTRLVLQDAIAMLLG